MPRFLEDCTSDAVWIALERAFPDPGREQASSYEMQEGNEKADSPERVGTCQIPPRTAEEPGPNQTADPRPVKHDMHDEP